MLARLSQSLLVLGRHEGKHMVKQSSTSPFKVMEEEAYHAFLEWPLWLVLREKELASYLAANRPQADPRAVAAAGAGHQTPEDE